MRFLVVALTEVAGLCGLFTLLDPSWVSFLLTVIFGSLAWWLYKREGKRIGGRYDV